MSAQASYRTWEQTYLKNGLARASDAAMEDLQTQFADKIAVAGVLGLLENAGGEGRAVDRLQQALDAAGTAIAQEREHQRKDALSCFPCTALLRAGRQLLEAWRAERDALQHLVQVHRQLEEDLGVCEECLDGSGLQYKEKDAVVQTLRDARKKHENAQLALEALTPWIKGGNQRMIKVVSQEFGLQGEVTLKKLRSDARTTLNDLTIQTLKLTGEIQRHFPEVILFVGQGLPPDLGSLWQPAQSLESFDEKQQVVTESRHRIWRVRADSEWFAIKEYSDGRADHLRTCLKEATIIQKQRHHAVVEIKALFQSTSGDAFYMQMPWYTHGALDKWVGGDQRPDWSQVRSVLLDALLGLAHLHENKVIHGDVKPGNILVDGRERGRLADFDISIDTKERTSAARVIGKTTTTMKATALGRTLDFAAPELLRSNQATKHTDMFAYGKTVLCIQDHCEPGAQVAGARGQTATLVTALTSEKPVARPSAKDAIKTPFFAILKDVCKKVTRTCLFCEAMGDDSVKEQATGMECSEGHFHCGQCVCKLTGDLLKVENSGQRALREGHVMCFKYPLECRAAGFHERDLARHLSVDDFQAYLKARMELMEQRLKMQLEVQIREEFEEEQRRLAAMDEHGRKVLIARKHIEEEILQMKCPRAGCRRAFFDFEGCFALSCSACPCKFCGWCLQDCGNGDAHPHVRGCGKVPQGVDALFPQMPDVGGAFEKTHNQRCRERVDLYVQTLELDIRGDVETIAQTLV